MPTGKGLSTLFELLKLYNSAGTPAFTACARRCWLCGAHARFEGLCAACDADLPRRRTLSLNMRIARVESILAPFRYAFPFDCLIRSAKFDRDLAAMHTLAAVTCKAVSDYLLKPDRIVPVPLSGLGYTRRGFNPAMELARPLASIWGREVDANSLRRNRQGPPQSSLPAAERRRNVSGAFAVLQPLRGETILIVDDVVTTGATLAAVAAALKQAGAGKLIALVAAAARPPS